MLSHLNDDATQNDVLSNLRQAWIVLEVTTPLSLGVMRPIGVNNCVHVVMPCLCNGDLESPKEY